MLPQFDHAETRELGRKGDSEQSQLCGDAPGGFLFSCPGSSIPCDGGGATLEL